MNTLNTLVPIADRRTTALQIARTSSSIATPEQLAVVLETDPRYCNLSQPDRVKWLGAQIIGVHFLVHSSELEAMDVFTEAQVLDEMIMGEDALRRLAQIEIQEAFRRGITREYGEFYGITAPNLLMFLRSYCWSAKRKKAIDIIYRKDEKRGQAETAKFWQAYTEARNDENENGFIIDFGHKHNVLSEEELRKHHEKIEAQRKEIFAKASANNTD